MAYTDRYSDSAGDTHYGVLLFSAFFVQSHFNAYIVLAAWAEISDFSGKCFGK